MKKLIFSILPAFLFAFISCMNMSSDSGENGSVRVALPGSSRAAYNKDDADKFIVRLYNDDFDQTEEGSLGGVIEFGDLEPGKYTAEAEAWNTAENLLEGSGSAKITVKAGETTDCNIKMILEGIFYSKYMLLPDSGGNMYAYDYLTCTEKKNWPCNSFPCLYFAESNDGSIYYVKQNYNSSLDIYDNYYTWKYNFDTDKAESAIVVQNINTGFFDGCYDSTTDIYWVVRNGSSKLYLYKDGSGYNTGITQNSFGDCAIRGENLYYSFGDDSIGYAKFDYTSETAVVKPEKTLADFGVSGTITDMAVLEDGTVAVLVRSVGVGTETEGFGNMSLKDKGTVYSRGALVLLSSDLSTYEVYGWKDSSREIRATGKDTQTGTLTEWTSITAYIPEYEERNSHFYGPVKIVAIRPKELVIADCGANFVLPDYDGKKNGKMYAHNRLMTVNLRNFAIGCKKEFSESELKFKDLMISGGSTDSYTIQASSSYNACETEK